MIVIISFIISIIAVTIAVDAYIKAKHMQSFIIRWLKSSEASYLFKGQEYDVSDGSKCRNVIRGVQERYPRKDANVGYVWDPNISITSYINYEESQHEEGKEIQGEPE